MKLAERCRHWFPASAQEWGEILASQGSVTLRQREPGLVTALVRDVNGQSYACGAHGAQAAVQRRIELGCECPFKPEAPACKHLWAFLVALDRQQQSKLIPGVGPVEVVRPNQPAFLGGGRAAPLPLRQRGRELADQLAEGQLSAGQAADVRKDWRLWLEVAQALCEQAPAPSRAAPTRIRRLWYFLDVPQSQEAGFPAIRLAFQEAGKTGPGMIQPIKVVEHRDLVAFTDPVDQELIRFLAPGRKPGERFDLAVDLFFAAPPMLELLMSRMSASRRMALHEFGGPLEPLHPEKNPPRPIEWDGGANWQFEMLLESRDGSPRVEGRMVRGGRERPLSEVKALLPCGVVIFPDSAARFAADMGFPWAKLLTVVGDVPAPASDQAAILQRLLQHPRAPRIRAPKELGWEQIESAGQPRISFTPLDAAFRNRLGAKIGFRYGHLETEWRKPEPKLVDAEHRTVAYRRMEHEKELVDKLAAAGLSTPPEPLRAQYDFTLPARLLPTLVPKLREEGWEIEAEGRRLRLGTTFGFSVASQVDWFELRGSIDFEGATVSLPTLLKAIERGDRYVLLDDGSQGMLPEEWLEKFSGLATLGKTEGDAVKFTNAQAVLLDALLTSAPKTEVDAKFQTLRERLRTIESVPPCREPEGFQGELRNYQRDGLAWISMLRELALGGCLADDMGLGKTIQVLAFLLQHHRDMGAKYGELPPLPPAELIALAEAGADEDDESAAPPDETAAELEAADAAAAAAEALSFDAEAGVVEGEAGEAGMVEVASAAEANGDAESSAAGATKEKAFAARIVKGPAKGSASAALKAAKAEEEEWDEEDLTPPSLEGRLPTLIVVPRSLVHNWLVEAAKFTPELRVLNYTGLPRKLYRPYLGSYDVVLTTYGTLRRDVLALRRQGFDYCILDEAQSIKNPNSQAAKSCRLVHARRRLAMTGTPVENHLGELWSLFEFLNPGMLGKAATFRRLAGEGRPSDAASLQSLSKALRPFLLRRTKEQVLEELPEKTEQTIYCELGKRQRQMYDELKAHYRQVLHQQIDQIGLARAKIQVLEALLRLRQAACHPGLIDASYESAPSAKLDALLDQLREVLQEEHKALVFSQFTSLLSLLRKRLDAENIPYEYLDGRTRNRGQKVEHFQTDPDCRLFLISLKAGGLGLNLTAADYVFILDPWWNPAVEAQAVDRAHRIGQTRRVFAYRLIARNTVEEKILELQHEKQQLADAVITADQRVLSHLSMEDLQLLLS